ncbi:MAG: hypothetical protein ACRDHP_14610 [Ktedonobacterales bacterium]
MSDSMDRFDSLADSMSTGDDPLPAEIETLHQRMLRDSTLWRAGLP